MPIISLAKREEEIFVLGRSESLRLPRRSPALRVLQQARDEAHRFAITFQRKRRAMRTVTSELLRIPGVGESKRRQLLAAFGSLQGVRDASPEAIAALPGFGAEDGRANRSARLREQLADAHAVAAASPMDVEVRDRRSPSDVPDPSTEIP